MTRNYLIALLKTAGVITYGGRLNPVFDKRLKTNPGLTQHILNCTSFLRGDNCLKARLHVLLLGITEQPVCIGCGRDVGMRLDGKYRFTFPKHCGRKCVSEDLGVRAKRLATNMKRYGAPSYLTSNQRSDDSLE